MRKAMALLSMALLGLGLAGGCGGNVIGGGGSRTGSGGGSPTGSGGGGSPAAPGSMPCRTSADCPMGADYYCVLETNLPCGLCNWQGFQCGQAFPCDAGAYCNACDACVAPCQSDADCAATEACDPTTQRCGARPCAMDSECPTNFQCAEGACARKVCGADADCQGFCAGGQCVSQLGSCFDCV